jgi:IclR family transcriptional regulator, KDG regulon repressor
LPDKKSDSEYLLDGALRVTEVLTTLSMYGNGIRLAELDEKLSINKTTLYRLLITLKSVNYVSYDEETKKYSLGYAILKMSGNVSETQEVTKVAHSFIKELSEELGETVILVHREGTIKYIVDKVETKNVIRRIIELGEESPIVYSASGRIILAFMPESEVDEILQNQPIIKLTSNTITDIEEIKKAIKKANKDGYSISNGERLDGVFSVSAPIFTPRGRVDYSVSVAIPEYRVKLEVVGHLIDKIKSCGEKITAALKMPVDLTS